VTDHALPERRRSAVRMVLIVSLRSMWVLLAWRVVVGQNRGPMWVSMMSPTVTAWTSLPRTRYGWPFFHEMIWYTPVSSRFPFLRVTMARRK
jgi:hypothetical protein